MICLNLGCGPRLFRKPWINADILPGIGADLEMDVNERWPFKDNSLDQIWANHVLEHGWDKVHLISELWRVCKHQAFVQVRVPIYSWTQFYDDPGHRSCWTPNSFGCFDVNNEGHTAQPYKHIEFSIPSFSLRDGWELAWDLVVVKPDAPDAEPPIPVPQEGATI